MFPFLFGMSAPHSSGPIKQTVLRDKKLVISTANNGGMPFHEGGGKPAGAYETVLMRFDSVEDIDGRTFKSIRLLATYRRRADAIRGHLGHVRKFRRYG